MALTTISIPQTKALALTTSYLASGDEIYIDAMATQIHLWSTDDTIALTYKFSVGGGAFVEVPAPTAKDIWVIDKKAGTDILINAKSASGTPSVNIMVT